MQEQPSYIREVEVALLRREEIKKLKVQPQTTDRYSGPT
jgi:hypothetical protein